MINMWNWNGHGTAKDEWHGLLNNRQGNSSMDRVSPFLARWSRSGIPKGELNATKDASVGSCYSGRIDQEIKICSVYMFQEWLANSPFCFVPAMWIWLETTWCGCSLHGFHIRRWEVSWPSWAESSEAPKPRPPLRLLLGSSTQPSKHTTSKQCKTRQNNAIQNKAR